MFHDQPILNRKDDQYDRYAFAKEIGNVFISTPENKSICVGLSGSWGSGKTSLINMVKEYIESTKTKPYISVMFFQPWYFSSSEQLISQFFIQLADFFGIKNTIRKKIGEILREYAKHWDSSLITSLFFKQILGGQFLADAAKVGADQLGKALEESSFVAQNIQKQKEKLHSYLEEKFDEKMVIIIDDIDRLSDDQIRCVFQLVTIICKFPKINYLLSFDREAVAKALDKYQDGKGSEFLDKVIQVPLSIPSLHKDMIHQTLLYHIIEMQTKLNIRFFDLSKWDSIYDHCARFLVTTHRDVSRLYNEAHVKVSLLSGNLDLVDILTLIIIEQHEPHLFHWIEMHRNMLVGRGKYIASPDQETEKPIIITDEWLIDQDKEIISNRKTQINKEISALLLHKNVFSTEHALEVLSLLFPSFSHIMGNDKNYIFYDYNAEKRLNCICDPTNFDRFFSYSAYGRYIFKDENRLDDYAKFIVQEASDETIKIYMLSNKHTTFYVNLYKVIRDQCSLSIDRAQTIILCLIQIGDYIDDKVLETGSTALFDAVFLVIFLLMKLPEKKRFTLLEDIIHNMQANNIEITSSILEKIDWCMDYEAFEEDVPELVYKYFDQKKRFKYICRKFMNQAPLSKDHYDTLVESYWLKSNGIITQGCVSDMMKKKSFLSYYDIISSKHHLIENIQNYNALFVIKYMILFFTNWVEEDGERKSITTTEKYKLFISDGRTVQNSTRSQFINQLVDELSNEDGFRDMTKDDRKAAVALAMQNKKLTIATSKIDSHYLDTISHFLGIKPISETVDTLYGRQRHSDPLSEMYPN